MIVPIIIYQVLLTCVLQRFLILINMPATELCLQIRSDIKTQPIFLDCHSH
ncbi:hypothetical protein HOLleu_18349 [Holothuria leucospilota]|uniref:Uncharacterized protein n=1 Tax=Holothuria leucospilota TaxID=206669 RepID=A0A9Q1C2Q5_HOLLE|nr:hypothetical protein HOLleu_18349 [Holothuria leucospilota]